MTGAILILCAFLGLSYGLNLFKTISATVSLQKLDKQIASVSSTIGKLDSEYLQLSRQAAPEAMSKYGLSQGTVSVFISPSSASGRVAMAGAL
jgi:hypothetical protein